MTTPKKDERVRQAILEAAKRVFQRWGLNKTTMEDIAREAGKGKSTLYYYFPSKEQIFDIVVQSEISGLLERAKTSVQKIASPKDRLKAYVVACLTETKNTVVLYDIVRTELQGDPHFIDKVRKRFEKGELSYLSRILAEGVRKKEFTFSGKREIQTAAEVILEMTEALELHFFLEDFNAEHVDLAARLIANGL